MAASLFLGWLFASFHQPTHQTITKTQDTLPKVVDTVVSVRGKKALFIGDSHTAADYGWQHQVAKKTGMSYLNTAVGGKQTGWMLEQAKQKVTEYFDYCFIYGGANDMAGNRPPIKSVNAGVVPLYGTVVRSN